MATTRVSFLIAPIDPWRDILLVELQDLGYDGFEELTGGLDAYIDPARFDAVTISKLLTLRDPHSKVSWSHSVVQDRNWNADWESSFQPVEVGKEVRIRAGHHPKAKGYRYELEITPRMAFGTGHHATTRMMVRAMLGLVEEGGKHQGPDLKGATVCDLGCGTAVLAILAEHMGAHPVLAIDNDQQAVDNARDNVAANACKTITVEKGDAGSLKGEKFTVILANIERNTLLKAMPLMAAALNAGGALFLSGFVVADRPLLAESAAAHGLVMAEELEEGEWALLGCRKPGRTETH